MKRGGRQASPNLPTTLLLLVVAVAAAASCYEGPPGPGEDRPPGKGIYIGSAWQTHRGVNGHKVHVVEKKIACSKCHELTDDAIGPVTPARCADCHEKEARIEHAAERAQERFGAAVKADCTSCHAFTLDGTPHDAGFQGLPKVPAPSDCARCHAQDQGDVPAVSVHGTSECLSCHRPHEDERPKSAPCEECHEDVQTTHAAKDRSPTEVCTTCHAFQHAPASTALATCTECHAEHEPKVPATALFAEGHTECVGCHRPHDFERKQSVACRSCHEDVRVLAAPRVREHNQCSSCHAPHDVSGSPDRACSRCHTAVHPDHPKHGVAGTCVGCHDPHPSGGAAHALTRGCSHCHQTAHSDTSFHAGVGCKQCHAPHDFVLEGEDRALCGRCHGNELRSATALAGHSACEGCHAGLPHHPGRRLSGCETCHADVHRSLASGHSPCTGCHEPHGGSLLKDCKSCHAAEHQTAPVGHRTCTQCHEQHSGATAKAPCSSCHAPEARSAHGRLGATCNQCHRPHGPGGVARPPSCTSCHSTPTLSGLHHVREHRDCARCHSGHGDSVATMRATCLGCHTDRTNHFPNSPSCSGCHLFTPTR